MHRAVRTVFFITAFLTIFTAAGAQERRWVQIEARPTLPQAEDRLRDYETRLDNVNGFRLSSGWYAIALGPYTPEIADAVRARLRATRSIPADSFIADGSLFRQQVWPEGAGFGPVEPIATITARPLDPGALQGNTAEPVAAAPQGETLADARAAERALTRPDREDIQRALQWEGVYNARIDGAFGPGTRRAIEAWQATNGLPVTGVLTTLQRNRLVNEFQEAVASLGLTTVTDPEAGVEITLPAAMVARDNAESPFVRYGPRDGSGVELLLISLPGDAATLSGLFDVMQTLELVPLTGPRDLDGRSFTLIGENADIVSHTYAEQRADAVKGFTLVWPRGDEKRRQKVLAEMRASFTPLPGIVLPSETVTLAAATRRDLLAGLEVRQPRASLSGFYVDDRGHLLSAADGLAGCDRITLGIDEADADVIASDDRLGLALLRPRTALAPLTVAAFDPAEPRLDSELAVAGFSFGGALAAPSLTFGRVADTASLDGRAALSRLNLMAEDGDAGGPLLDERGAVRGVLLARDDTTRRLPQDVHYAAEAEAVVTFLSDNEVTPRAAEPGAALSPVAMDALAADITVLVRCWN